jgi:hypothetical protein
MTEDQRQPMVKITHVIPLPLSPIGTQHDLQQIIGRIYRADYHNKTRISIRWIETPDSDVVKAVYDGLVKTFPEKYANLDIERLL